ncbi:MAG: flagellar hook-basal body complex protein [Halocynthiibacter sp.]
MDNIGYTSLSRQTGLRREMDAVANNIANMSTTGYRKEGILFSEYISRLERDQPSLSMTDGGIRNTNYTTGTLTQTNGMFDFAIDGDGFFLVATEAGTKMTRAGGFTPNETGQLATSDGALVLDISESPISIPASADDIMVGGDGTISANGTPIAQIGTFIPIDMNALKREQGTLFATDGGYQPVDGQRVLQGFLEGSNVNPIEEITRMIEVQRAYEQSAKFLDKEDERIRSVIKTLGQ